MQSIERHFAAFVARFGKQLDDAERRYRDEAGAFGEDTESIALSKRGALHFLGATAMDSSFIAAARFAEALQAWAAYRQYRYLYAIDDTLAEALPGASWPEALDVTTLFLPVPGAAMTIRLPGSAARADFIGFYDTLPVPGGHERQLRFSRIHDDGSVVPCGSIGLPRGSLEGALREQERKTREYVEARGGTKAP